MSTLSEKRNLRRSAFAREQSSFKLPNPGDAFLLVAFGWATICFLMVTGGQRLARMAAMQTASQQLREVILSEQTGIAALMIVGILGIAAVFALCTRFKTFSIAFFLFSLSFANASWPLLHTVAFAGKYILIVYLAAYGALFFVRNGWKLIDSKGHRLACLYVAWIGLVAVINGFRVADIWYTGTEFVFMISFGIAWLSNIDNLEELEKYNRIFAYTGIVATGFHLLSPLVISDYTVAGRFVSMFGRATGFATIFSLFVVAMFWLSMIEKRPLFQRFFLVCAMVGYLLILWSGTRNATVATFIAIGALWWVFRAKIFYYVAGAGMVGLVIQILLGGSDTLDTLSTRLASTKNDRLGAWELYIGMIADRPFLGYGHGGLAPALYGEAITSLIGSFRRIQVPGTHNHYIGFGVRFGLIGLAIFVSLFYLPLRQAWRVVFSKTVSSHAKQVYILPVALLLLVALEGIFEDNVGSTGRGTLHHAVLGCAIPLVYLFGQKLISESESKPQ